MKRVSVALVLGTLVAFDAEAYCPSYTPAGTASGSKCGVEPVAGKNPSLSEWNSIFTIVSAGPSSWGTSGPTVKSIKRGCNLPTAVTEVPPVFPCNVLKAIAMVESGWQQFCKPDSPSSSVGAPERTIVSFDCGYGIGQVTSGMHIGESPDFDRARVASDATYNLATGTRILRDKWGYTSCVGDRLPEVVEHWYTSVWAYNGLAYSNNPNNPNLTANRKPYNPKNGGSYTYQEKVYGRMEYPTSAEHWSSVAVAYPDRATMSPSSGNPGAIGEPSCEGPTSCVGKRGTHLGSCGGKDVERDGGVASDGGFGDASVWVPEGGPRNPSSDPASGASNLLPAEDDSSGCSYHSMLHIGAGRGAGLLLLATLLFVRRLRRQ